MSIHVSEITAHCQDDIVSSIMFRLRKNITYELGDLNMYKKKLDEIFDKFLGWIDTISQTTSQWIS